jgi:bleomycin hydrolase
MLAKFDKQVAGDPSIKRIINAATNNSIKDLSLNRELVTRHDGRFNFELKSSKIIDQKSSGRCWMFAGANTVTPKVMTKLKLSEFTISQAYIAFYDRLEKSNFFLEAMIAMRDIPVTDRVLAMYLQNPIGDGGWWTYFEGLIRKYGVVPASAMPETKQSSSTGSTNMLLSTLLRKGAAEIRNMAAKGENEPALRQYKDKMLGDIYRLLVSAYGRPPQEFVFRYEETKKFADTSKLTDSTKKADSTEKKVLVEKTFTPQSFFTELYGDLTTEYVAIVNNPAEKERTLFEFENSRNIFEQPDIRFLNMPIEALKKYTYKMIRDSQIVWFACDVGRDNFGDSGMFISNVWDYSTTLGIDFSTNKADRIRYRDTDPNHAMVILGVDTALNGSVRKWKVENSWGSSPGSGGFWTMYDSWFDDNILLVMVDKKLLDADDAQLLDQKPVKVEEWRTFFKELTEIQ